LVGRSIGRSVKNWTLGIPDSEGTYCPERSLIWKIFDQNTSPAHYFFFRYSRVVNYKFTPKTTSVN
jgi:hypothetical protein